MVYIIISQRIKKNSHNKLKITKFLYLCAVKQKKIQKNGIVINFWLTFSSKQRY